MIRGRNRGGRQALVSVLISACCSVAGACGVVPADLHQWTVVKAQKYGLDPDLLVSLVWIESRYCVRAVSPDGAQGLGQLMPGTAREVGVSDSFNPVQNLDGAARYLRRQWDTFHDWPLALAAYNAGPGRVMDAGLTVPAIAETQAYVQNVLGTYVALKRSPLRWTGAAYAGH